MTASKRAVTQQMRSLVAKLSPAETEVREWQKRVMGVIITGHRLVAVVRHLGTQLGDCDLVWNLLAAAADLERYLLNLAAAVEK